MRLSALLATALLLAGCSQPLAAPATTTANPYVPLAESPVRGLTPEEIEAIRTGAGMRLALPAELNGYPGPKHILELAEPLGLDEATRARVQDLYDRTNAAAREAGDELLARWEALDNAFRAGGLDEATLRMLVERVDGQNAEVRFIHLRAHLEADGLLTEHQKALYAELRGYGSADHGEHPH
jgi:Spy/CpxP family protein refolding chaperone